MTAKAAARSRKNHAKRRKVILEAKVGGCVDCQEVDPVVLHFDHRDPSTKSFNISSKSVSMERLLAEIAKCDVRCANCHLRKHHKTRLSSP